ncbi:unnamed protein product [Linum trigynum]|uniref:Secreted protein n=1 Tax=Linum trigynum TaxID=586398 RepID=A0AAV2CTE4_9ROSI
MENPRSISMLLVFHACHMCSRHVVTLLAPCHLPHVTTTGEEFKPSYYRSKSQQERSRRIPTRRSRGHAREQQQQRYTVEGLIHDSLECDKGLRFASSDHAQKLRPA